MVSSCLYSRIHSRIFYRGLLLSSKVLFEDKLFRVVHGRDYVVVRRDGQYSQHSHFKKYSGAMTLITLYYKKLIPREEYFRVAMQRITTEEEYKTFTQQRGHKPSCVKRRR